MTYTDKLWLAPTPRLDYPFKAAMDKALLAPATDKLLMPRDLRLYSDRPNPAVPAHESWAQFSEENVGRVNRSLNRELLLLWDNLRLYREIRQTTKKNESQKHFLEMVAHDVQNPLTAILAYAEILGNRLKGLPKEHLFATHIRGAAEMLQHLITDLVDLAAIESGKLRINPRIMDLGQVVREVEAFVAVAAKKKKVRITVSIPRKLPAIIADPARLSQVLQNLCLNAIQYTPHKGRIAVEVRLRRRLIQINVSDTGIGITSKDLPHVFKRYYRGRGAEQFRRAGFGLGLEISRQIVRMHGGKITVRSTPGKGSDFRFTLPLKPC